MAYYCVNVQKQLHCILDTLTKGAVAEISKLIEDGSAVLRLEIIHSRKENETLKMKLQEMETELKTAREYGMRREEFKDAFAANFCLPANEEDLPQRAVVEQGSQLLSESVIKKERLDDQENSLGSGWRGHILEAERSASVEWDSRLNGDMAAETQPDLGAGPEQFGWAEPGLLQGHSEDTYADFCYAAQGDAGSTPGQAELHLLPVSEGAEPFKEEAALQPMWPEEAESEIGPSHEGRYRDKAESRVGAGNTCAIGQVLRPCSVRGESPTLQDSAQTPQSPPARETPAASSLATERPFLCSHCGKGFSWNISLKRHLLSHAQHPKSFPDQQSLSAHQRNHKRDRRFSCATCGKSFFRKHHLKSHQRTHTGERPYRCTYCGKDYKQLSNLISHQRSHTGERPYSCTDCGKCFHRLDNLKAHQRIHTRVRKFVCAFANCKESFDQKYLFERHLLLHVT